MRDPDGRVAFVRHAYGDRGAWELPGGGRHRGEAAVQTARREAAEELGLELEGWRELGTVHGVWTRSRLELAVCEAPAPAGARLRPDPVEIAEAVWADPDRPPGRVGPVTVSALRLVR